MKKKSHKMATSKTATTKKVAKKKTSKKKTGVQVDLPIEPVKAESVTETVSTSSEAVTKTNCWCCNQMVDVNILKRCNHCGFNGCQECSPKPNCPSCDTQF